MSTSAEAERRLADEVTSHKERVRLAGFAFDVLSRQAEGRVLFAGREYVESRAAHHGVTRELAEMPSGNLLAILERGAQTDHERALVTALAVHGFGVSLADGIEGEPALVRFIRHADWLETATPFTPYAYLDRMLAPEAAARVYHAIAEAILAERGDASGGRARNVVRLGALARSRSEAAEAARREVASKATDPTTRALVRALCPDEADTPSTGPVLRGRLAPAPPRGGVVGVLRLVTGWALLAWIGHGLARLVGLRTEGELELAPRGIRFARRTELLGRPVREGTEQIARSAVQTASRTVRYPRVRVLVGAITLALGVLAGSLVLADGVASGDTVVLLVGASLLLGGAALDLFLTVLLPASRGEVTVELDVAPHRRVRLVGVSADDADAWLRALDASP